MFFLDGLIFFMIHLYSCECVHKILKLNKEGRISLSLSLFILHQSRQRCTGGSCICLCVYSRLCWKALPPPFPFPFLQRRQRSRRASGCRSTARPSLPSCMSWGSAWRLASRRSWPPRSRGWVPHPTVLQLPSLTLTDGCHSSVAQKEQVPIFIRLYWIHNISEFLPYIYISDFTVYRPSFVIYISDLIVYTYTTVQKFGISQKMTAFTGKLVFQPSNNVQNEQKI